MSATWDPITHRLTYTFATTTKINPDPGGNAFYDGTAQQMLFDSYISGNETTVIVTEFVIGGGTEHAPDTLDAPEAGFFRDAATDAEITWPDGFPVTEV